MSQEALNQFQAAMERRMQPDPQTIELDCPPGFPRPGDLIGMVIANLGLEAKEPVSKFFGNWIWDYSDVPPERWKEIQPTLKEKITALYNDGVIRYGSW